ncbi:MAG: hypothetical protein GXW85_10845 [Clostridia bacterium]|nr:hypothetical protein [Clostridia bacterium]
MDTKKLVTELLAEEKYEQIIKLAGKKHSQTLKYIQMHLFEDINKPIRWYAIEALGRLAKEFASKEPEAYRNLLRRFLWAMNDESGNVPWSSPEAMASVIANQPFLLGDFTPFLITNALDNPMCHRGMLWAAGRIGRVRNILVLPFVKEITAFLSSDNADLRGYAVWALGEIGYQDGLPQLKKIQNDKNKICIFKDGKLVTVEVGTLSQEAVSKLEKVS